MKIPVGETKTLQINYKRNGSDTSTKTMLLFIKHELDDKIKFSVECENLFYRGVNKSLLESAKSFAGRNGLQCQPHEKHTVLEEIIYVASWLSDKAFTYPNVPSKYSQSRTSSYRQVTNLLSKIIFLREDIQRIIDEAAPLEAKKNVDGAEDGIVFRRQEAGYWLVKYRNEEAEIPDKAGIKYLHFLVGKVEEYHTLQEIYDALHLYQADGVTTDSTLYREDGERKRISNQYSKEVSKLKSQIEEITDALKAAETVDPEIIKSAKQTLEGKEKKLKWYQSELASLKHGTVQRGKANKNKGDTVNIAIKRAYDAMSKAAPDFVAHLQESIEKKEFEPGRGSGSCVKRSYRPDPQIKWELS